MEEIAARKCLIEIGTGRRKVDASRRSRQQCLAAKGNRSTGLFFFFWFNFCSLCISFKKTKKAPPQRFFASAASDSSGACLTVCVWEQQQEQHQQRQPLSDDAKQLRKTLALASGVLLAVGPRSEIARPVTFV